MTDEVIPRKVEAVAVSANLSTVSQLRAIPGAAKVIEAAMASAVAWCYENGITEPDEIKNRMQVARENAKRALLEIVTPEGNEEG